jgi:Tol biopolymer transport system component
MTLATATPVGPYEILAPLGAGGMGEVYRARDPRLGREVAIKVLPEALADDPSRLGRFEREAKATGALSHPNILAIHDIGEHEGRPYVVYELLEGQTLGERMREGPLRPREALTWAMQVARGLAAAHARGIVHRDLKPENLFLTKTGPLKILDFGLAKVARPEAHSDASIDPEDLTAEEAILGTVGYMSPEQVKGERADHRSDIFSLGVVLYEMLSGRRPFRGGAAPETMAAILKEDPPALPEDGVSPPVAEVVGRCLEKKPEARFQSAHDLSLSLEVLAASEDESRPAVTALAPQGSPVRWGRSVVLLGGALVVVAGLFFALRYLMAPAGPPRLENVTRITPPGFQGTGLLSTDGQRLYYASQGRLFQMPAAGGPAVEIQPWGEEGGLLSRASLSPADPTQLLVFRHDGPGAPVPMVPVPLWVVTLPAATPRRLGEATASSATWSPDGAQVAFGRGNEIHVVDRKGRASRRILTAEANVWVYDWGSDERITYMLWSLRPGSGIHMEPWQMKADGSEARRLLPDWPGASFIYARWTPDLRYLIFASGGDIRGGEIFALPVETTDPIPLTTGMHCGVEPGPAARRLYANCVTERSEPFVYRPEVGEWAPHEFAPDSSPRQIAWSPDGEWVTWVRYPEGTLWRSRTDGSQKLRLTEPAELGVTMPRWSPDGQWISFIRSTPEGVPLQGFVVSRDGQGLRPVTEDEHLHDTTAWSPDGRVVVSSVSQEDSQPAIRVVAPDTGTWEELPGTEGYIGVNSSPDGRLLVAHEWEGVPGDVYPGQVHLFDWETGGWRDLDIEGGMLNWSADGRSLYHFCGERDGSYCRLDLDNGEIERVAEPSSLSDVSFWVSVDPDGRIVGQRALSTPEIYVGDLVLP